MPETLDIVCRLLFTVIKMKKNFPGNLETTVLYRVEQNKKI